MEILDKETRSFYLNNFDFEEFGYLPKEKIEDLRYFSNLIGFRMECDTDRSLYLSGGAIRGKRIIQTILLRRRTELGSVCRSVIYSLNKVEKKSIDKYENHIHSTYSGQAGRYANLAKKIRQKQCNINRSSSHPINISSMKRSQSLGDTLRRMNTRKRYVLRGII